MNFGCKTITITAQTEVFDSVDIWVCSILKLLIQEHIETFRCD